MRSQAIITPCSSAPSIGAEDRPTKVITPAMPVSPSRRSQRPAKM